MRMARIFTVAQGLCGGKMGLLKYPLSLSCCLHSSGVFVQSRGLLRVSLFFTMKLKANSRSRAAERSSDGRPEER